MNQLISEIKKMDLKKDSEELSIDEIAQLDWYDMLSYMGLESFNWTGMGSWDDLIKLCSSPSPLNTFSIKIEIKNESVVWAQTPYSFFGN